MMPLLDELSQPTKYPDFKRKLTRINEFITNFFKHIDTRSLNNRTCREKRALKNLVYARISSTIRKAKICVINGKKYAELGFQHLMTLTPMTVSILSSLKLLNNALTLFEKILLR